MVQKIKLNSSEFIKLDDVVKRIHEHKKIMLMHAVSGSAGIIVAIIVAGSMVVAIYCRKGEIIAAITKHEKFKVTGDKIIIKMPEGFETEHT
jgi:hypothetical protein